MKYSSLDKINFFFAAYGRLFSCILKASLWLPFFILGIAQAAGLYVFSKFYIDGLYQIIHPILSRFFPQEIFHFPQYYMALPSIYSGYSTFFLGPTIGVILTAAAVYKFGGYYQNKKRPLIESVTVGVRSFLPLLIFWLIETVLVFVVLYGLSSLFAGSIQESPKIRFVAEYCFRLITFIFSALLVYSIPGIVLSGNRLFSAIGDSVKTCFGNFFLTFFIVAIPGSLGAVIDILISGFSIQIITLFDPDLILWLLYLRIGLGIFINLFIYGAAVHIYKEMND